MFTSKVESYICFISCILYIEFVCTIFKFTCKTWRDVGAAIKRAVTAMPTVFANNESWVNMTKWVFLLYSAFGYIWSFSGRTVQLRAKTSREIIIVENGSSSMISFFRNDFHTTGLTGSLHMDFCFIGAFFLSFLGTSGWWSHLGMFGHIECPEDPCFPAGRVFGS